MQHISHHVTPTSSWEPQEGRVTQSLQGMHVTRSCAQPSHTYSSLAWFEVNQRCTLSFQAAAASSTGSTLLSFPLLSLSQEVLSDSEAEDEAQGEQMGASDLGNAMQRLPRCTSSAAQIWASWSFKIEFEGSRFRRVGMPKSLTSSPSDSVLAHICLCRRLSVCYLVWHDSCPCASAES
jgi:hypothetical protein